MLGSRFSSIVLGSAHRRFLQGLASALSSSEVQNAITCLDIAIPAGIIFFMRDSRFYAFMRRSDDGEGHSGWFVGFAMLALRIPNRISLNPHSQRGMESY
jgi:hypothetical protein